MAVKYQLSQSELEYLIALGNEGSGEEKQPEEQQMAASQESLIEKGYIQEGEDRKILVQAPLVSLLRSVFTCEAVLFAVGTQKDGKKQIFCFYFNRSRIYFAEQRQEGLYDLFEIPSLSLAAGMLANRIEIREEASKNVTQISLDQDMKEFGLEIDPDQIEKQWVLMGESRTNKKKRCMFLIVESADIQNMMELKEGNIIFSNPGKVDFINACLDWMREGDRNGNV